MGYSLWGCKESDMTERPRTIFILFVSVLFPSENGLHAAQAWGPVLSLVSPDASCCPLRLLSW